MKQIPKNSIIALQIGYFLMFFANGVGNLNRITNDLGYIIWPIFAILSLIIGVLAFYKTQKRTIICLSILCVLEIGFCAFIWILPSIMGIPF